jgi:hypothetical protein
MTAAAVGVVVVVAMVVVIVVAVAVIARMIRRRCARHPSGFVILVNLIEVPAATALAELALEKGRLLCWLGGAVLLWRAAAAGQVGAGAQAEANEQCGATTPADECRGRDLDAKDSKDATEKVCWLGGRARWRRRGWRWGRRRRR